MRPVALIVVLAAWLSGCSAPQTRQLLRDWPAQAPASVLLDQVPFNPQERYQCGPAALATVLQYRGTAVQPDELIDEVYLPAREGSLQAEMIAAARARGALVYSLAPRIDALLAELRAGNPVLVLQNLGLDLLPRWHYAVVIGYDQPTQSFILRSGTLAERRTLFFTFEHTWARSGYWALVVLRPGELPASAELRPYLRATLALQRAGGASLPSYRAATERWAEQPLAWLSLGNAQLGAGEVRAAAEAYRQAVAVDTGDAIAWNNYASALGLLGCGATARVAAACAQAIEPQHAAILETVEEVSEIPEGTGQCPQLTRCTPP